MLQSAHSLARLAGFAAALLTLGAVGLGRIAPGPEARTAGFGPLVGVSTHRVGPPVGALKVLDVRADEVRRLELDRSDRVDLAIGSPWVDGWDRAQVVGRWASMGPDLFLQDTGVIRLAYPSGRVLDRVSLSHYPVSPPCWGSGTSDRILFVSGDGGLYRLDFAPAADAKGLDGSPGLSRVRWRDEGPGERPPYLLDVARADAGLPPDLVLATVVPPGFRQGLDHPHAAQIWWLRLDAEEHAILDGGPVGPLDPTGEDVGRRRPSLGRRADGSLWLAYQSWSGVAERMILRVAPARVDEATGVPAVDATSGTALAEGCLNVAPSFADGGTRLAFLVHGDSGPEPRRIDLAPSPSPTALAAVVGPAGR